MSAQRQPAPEDNQRKIQVLPPSYTDAPYSQEAEEALIGAVLINPDFLKSLGFITPDTFFFLRHSYVWQAMLDLVREDLAVDIVTVSEKLNDLKLLNEVGGPAFLTQVMSNTPTSVHAAFYASLVQRTYLRRRMMQTADETRALAADSNLPIEEVFAAFQQQLIAFSTDLHVDEPTFADQVNIAVDVIEQAMNSPTAIGVPTGIYMLDRMLDGWHRGKVAVVAGRKHMGKTGFMQTCALNAVKAKRRVLFFNCADGTDKDVINNLIGMEADVLPHAMLSGRLTQQQYARVLEVSSRLTTLKDYMFIRHKKAVTIGEFWQQASQIHHEHGLDVIFIDYLQRMSAGSLDREGEYRRLAFISQRLTQIAERLKVPIVVGAQINRGAARKRPTADDIKGCGNIEEDADVVILVNRPATYNKSEPADLTELIVDKNKITRQLGLIRTRTSQATARFTDWSQR